MDCTDIKVLLSGLIDDELDSQTRHEAERHLAQCRRCRELIDEHESLDKMVAIHVRSLVDGRGLPGGFEERVLSRTLYARPRAYLQQWTTWAGWVAAAAALVLAVTIWSMDRRTGLPVPPPVDSDPGMVLPATYNEASRLQSLVYNGAAPPEASEGDFDEMEGLLAGSAPQISREDAETLYLTSVLLQILAASDSGFVDAEHVRRAVEYDGLLARLDDLRTRMTVKDRPAVLAAESLFVSVLRGPLRGEDIDEIRDTVNGLELDETIGSMSDRGMLIIDA